MTIAEMRKRIKFLETRARGESTQDARETRLEVDHYLAEIARLKKEAVNVCR